MKDPRKRLSRIERTWLPTLPGDLRACYWLKRLGKLTATTLQELKAKVPPTWQEQDRCAFIVEVRKACADVGLDSGWTEADQWPDAMKKLILRWFVVDGAMHSPKVPADSEAAWLAFRFWVQQPPYGDERPGLDRDCFIALFTEMQAADLIHAWELD